MGEGGGDVKEPAKLLFAGFLWAAFICYTDEWEIFHAALWHSMAGGSPFDGRSALYGMILIFTVVGLAGDMLDNVIIMVVFLICYGILFVCNAIYMYHGQDLGHGTGYLACVIMGSMTMGTGVMLTVSLGGGGGK